MISPHLDDGVFACGQMLGQAVGSTVITVFTGMPLDSDRLTDWDRQCGFSHARQAMLARLEEDRNALARLQAHPLWLDFVDSQYGSPPTVDQVCAKLVSVLRDMPADTVLFPMGLFHSDHFLVHEAALQALRECPHHRALVYEDALYRRMKGLLQQRLAELATAGLEVTPVASTASAPTEAKRDAVAAYRSQLRAFGDAGYDDVFAPERSWDIALKPDAFQEDQR
ncbi:PIG-L deacetylase family protein [Aquabacterium sp.]|uniref:PIG-L deacetylase family protein n=1 Tax=Aquabacterium sp. TaxID=1872578 RepID=UPI003D6D9290